MIEDPKGSAGPSVRREALLSGTSLRVTFGEIRAVDDVDVHVDRGEILGIVGPNGAGKTTLFNAMSGAARLDSGRLEFDGQPMMRLPSERRAMLGIARTFQNLLLLQHLSVRENVALGAAPFRRSRFVEVLCGLPRARRDDRLASALADRALAWVGLGQMAEVKAGSLPYADRRRVELARALCASPRLLLVDEPVAGMTTSESLEVAGALTRARDELGVTVIVVEHDMTFIRAVADRVLVMNLGSILAEGAPDDVLSRPEVAEAYLGTRHERRGPVAID